MLGAGQRTTALFPYAEFVKFEGLRKPPVTAQALALLRRHLARRPRDNPVLAFRDRLREQVVEAAEREPAFLHSYAFNTARQLGMNFELLGSHLAWLADAGAGPPLSAAAAPAKTCRAAPRASNSSSPARWRASASMRSRPPPIPRRCRL